MYNRYAQVKLKSGLSLSSSDSKALSPVATTVAGNGNYRRQCGQGLSRLQVDLESLLSQVESILLTSVTPRSMHASVIKEPTAISLSSHSSAIFKQDSWAIAKKTARCAQYMGALKSFESPHHAPDCFSRNLKFVALPVPEIIGDTQKICAVPVYAQAPFSPKFLKGFCSDGPSEYICQIWSS